MIEHRLDPSALTARQLRQLDRLSEAVLAEERPLLVGPEGARLDLPAPLFDLLARAVRALREGKALVLLPETDSLTTQAAADFLGVSRPFLVDLLEKGAIPYHKVGTHRRVYLKDVVQYQRRRDSRRHRTLDALRHKVEAAGLYEGALGDTEEH